MDDPQTLVPSWKFQFSCLFLSHSTIYPSYRNFSSPSFLNLLYIKAVPSSILFSFSHPLVRSSLFLLYPLFLHSPSYRHSSPLPSYSSLASNHFINVWITDNLLKPSGQYTYHKVTHLKTPNSLHRTHL